MNTASDLAWNDVRGNADVPGARRRGWALQIVDGRTVFGRLLNYLLTGAGLAGGLPFIFYPVQAPAAATNNQRSADA